MSLRKTGSDVTSMTVPENTAHLPIGQKQTRGFKTAVNWLLIHILYGQVNAGFRTTWFWLFAFFPANVVGSITHSNNDSRSENIKYLHALLC